jgi:molybdopterin synthase catalytic subunit
MAMKSPFSPRSAEAKVFHLVRNSIDIQKIVDSLQKPEDGAVVIFEGVVRNHSHGKAVRFLEYDAYETMALKKLEEVGRRAKKEYEIRDIAIVHRLGHLDVRECSAVIVVTSAHRGPAFQACRFAIDTIKEIVPIWKKEFYEDGEVWIEGGH